MLTEFALLATLTLNSDEREALRGEISKWVKCFLPKLERELTKTAKCRLIASVERHEFGDNWNAINWQFFKFVGHKGVLFDEDKIELQKFKATSFQKTKFSMRIPKDTPHKSKLEKHFHQQI